jgi:hypothetical protein
MMDSTCLLRELFYIELRRHVLSAIWGSGRERYGFDLRRHVLSII